MLDRLERVEVALRRVEAFLRELPPRDGDRRFGDPEPVPALVMDDPEKAKFAYEAAQAETKNQEQRGKEYLQAAQENEKRAKKVFDDSVAAAKEREAAEAKNRPQEPPPPATPPRAATSSRGD